MGRKEHIFHQHTRFIILKTVETKTPDFRLLDQTGPSSKEEADEPTEIREKSRLARPQANSCRAGSQRPAQMIQNLYGASRDNKSFLHSRSGLVADVTRPFKAIMSRWVCPDVTRNQNISVSKAKKAISDYRKETGELQGMAELTVFYCEPCTDFLGFYGMDDEGYFNALTGIFAQVLKTVDQEDPVRGRLSRSVSISCDGKCTTMAIGLGRPWTV
jgi:hypothetical protein